MSLRYNPDEREHSRSRSPQQLRSRSPDHRRRSHSPDHKRRRGNERSPERKRQRYSASPKRHRDVSPSDPPDRKDRRSDKVRRRSRSRSRDRDHRERKDKERRRSRSRSRSRERERREKKERKDKKKAKKERKKASANPSSHWGKYGVITELDMYTKGPEFHTWLVEERKINPETISKDQNRKEFLKFMEDYNTATLPHEKYYNMESYDRRMTAMRTGEYLPPVDDSYDPEADMRALSTAHKKKSAERETHLNREELEELRRVQNERIQAGKMKLLGMDIKQSMGVRMEYADE